MRTAVLIVALAFVASSYSAVVEQSALRSNLNVGSIGYYDRILASVNMYLPAANVVQAQDFVYRGNVTNRITAVQATEVGPTQFATPKMTSGGIGKSNVTIRFTTIKKYGFNYVVTVWGQ